MLNGDLVAQQKHDLSSSMLQLSWHVISSIRQGCDILKEPHGHNILETAGMLWSLRQALRVQDGGFGMLAIPCNSFGYMSSSGHQRTPMNPYGNPLWWVTQGSTIATRACLIILVLICRSCFWMVENPDRSMLQVFPPLVHIMSIPEIMPLRVHWLLDLILLLCYVQCMAFWMLQVFLQKKNSWSGIWDAGAHGAWSPKWVMEMR
jgi:hypothetical protein